MSASTATAVGTPLPEIVSHAKNVQARQGRTFEKNIHDDQAAQSFGFKRGFVAGGQTIGWISRMLVDFFGPAYFETGRFDCTFVAPVFDDEDIFVRGIVRDRIEEDDGVRLVCDVWLEKEDGAKSIVGTASAIVR
ncbi:MAG: MaoC family dehydratase [Dehalococcoidia bacterium]